MYNYSTTRANLDVTVRPFLSFLFFSVAFLLLFSLLYIVLCYIYCLFQIWRFGQATTLNFSSTITQFDPNTLKVSIAVQLWPFLFLFNSLLELISIQGMQKIIEKGEKTVGRLTNTNAVRQVSQKKCVNNNKTVQATWWSLSTKLHCIHPAKREM